MVHKRGTVLVPLHFRFEKNVEPSAGCWIWLGAKTAAGYGSIYRRYGKKVGAHRLSFELFNRRPPKRLHVLHRCDNPPCVNPAHLFLGTPRQNVRDMIAKGRARYPGTCRGERNGGAVLSEKIVTNIRRLSIAGVRQIDIAGFLQINKNTVQAVVSRRNWKWMD